MKHSPHNLRAKLVLILVMLALLVGMILFFPPDSLLIVGFFILLAAATITYIISLFLERTYQILAFCLSVSFLTLLVVIGFQPLILGLLLLFFISIGFLLKS